MQPNLATLLPPALALLCASAFALRSSPDAEEPWAQAERIVSNGGGYLLAVQASAEPLPENEDFALQVWVLDPQHPDAPLANVSLAADAGMPEHGHGMSREPAVRRRADGGFDVSGMLFHMGGTWELYLDVTRGALTERAQRTVRLE